MNQTHTGKQEAPRVVSQPSSCPFAPWVGGMPILGNTLAFLRDTTGFLLGAYRTHGPLFRIRMLWVRFTVLMGFEARAFLQAGGEQHLTRHPVFDPVGQQLGATKFALALSGDAHAQLRPLLQVAYSREIASPFVPKLIAAVQQVVHTWQPGSVRGVFEAVQEIGFEQYCQVMSRTSLRAHYRDCRLVTDMNMAVGGRVFPLWMFHWPPYRAARRRVLRLMDDLLRQRRAEHKTRDSHQHAVPPDILDTLLSVRFPDGQALTDAEVIAYAMYGFPGSCSYMGRVVAFMLYEILRRPDLYAALTREVDAAFAHGLADAADVTRMRLLRGVYHETLRFHPVSQGMPYIAKEDFTSCGYTVQQGAMVVLSQLSMLFADPPFTDPFVFDPSRCMEPRNEHRQAGVFHPFGMHQRTCVAMGLVELLAMTQVATLLHTLELHMAPSDYTLRMTVKPLPAPNRHFRMRSRVRHLREAVTRSAPPLREEVYLAAFPGADAPEVRAALATGFLEQHAPGSLIVRQGEVAKHFYVVAAGHVEVTRAQADGTSVHAAVLGPGDFFGEIGLLLHIPRTATVRVVGDAPATVLVMSAEAFRSIVTVSDMVSSEIARVVRRRTAWQQVQEWMSQHTLAEGLERLRGFTAQTIAPGTVILREGDAPDRFYVLWSGAITVLQRQADSTERPVAALERGAYFGELGLLHQSPRNATVRAAGESPSIVCSCDQAEFERLVREAGGVDGDLAWALSRRLLGQEPLPWIPGTPVG